MSDTPRTDKVIIELWGSTKPFNGHPVAEISRTLERELAEAEAKIETVRRETLLNTATHFALLGNDRFPDALRRLAEQGEKPK